MAKKIRNKVDIGKCVILKNVNKIVNNVSIDDFLYIGGAGGLTIGNDVSIAYNCSNLTTNHQWSDLDKPIKYNKENYKSILINNDVWVGCGVRILAGVEIKG